MGKEGLQIIEGLTPAQFPLPAYADEATRMKVLETLFWWWTNEEKADFKAAERIVYSDCYEVYGMKRTGCCGCPCELNIADELRIMAEHEPQLFKACMHVFGQSYELTDRFNCRRKKCLPESLQLTITGE